MITFLAVVTPGNSNLSNSFAEHPLPYILLAAGLIGLMLYIVFDTNSGVSQSILWALFASPISITAFAVLIGVGLDTQLPIIVVDNQITLRDYTPQQIARGTAVIVGGLVWLFLLARWFHHRTARVRTSVRKERPLSAELQAKMEQKSLYSVRPERDARGRKLPPPR